MPCGRTITAMIRTASATAIRYFVEIQYVDTCDATPMMMRADHRAVRGAETAEHDGREHQQQQVEAHVARDACH